MIPVAFAAERGGNRIVRLDTGHQDAGAALGFKVETAAVAPAGSSGDCAFARVRLAMTWSAQAVITVTPIVDGEAIPETHLLTLEQAAGRTSRMFELVMRRVSGRGVSRALRGTWFALRIEGALDTAGDVIIDPAALEYEVLTPTQDRT